MRAWLAAVCQVFPGSSAGGRSCCCRFPRGGYSRWGEGGEAAALCLFACPCTCRQRPECGQGMLCAAAGYAMLLAPALAAVCAAGPRIASVPTACPKVPSVHAGERWLYGLQMRADWYAAVAIRLSERAQGGGRVKSKRSPFSDSEGSADVARLTGNHREFFREFQQFVCSVVSAGTVLMRPMKGL